MTESVNKIANKGKINWLLILQAWAMLWVVIGHSSLDKLNCPTWNMQLVTVAYMFHMQLFVMVSGYLFRITRLNKPDQWNYSNTIKEKTIRLGIPGFFFSFVALGLKFLFPGEMSRQAELTFGGIVHSYLFPCDNAFQEIWFVVVLFWLFLLMPIWRLSIKNRCFEILTLIIVFVLSYLHPNTSFLCIDRVFEYSIWFYLGVFLARFDINELGVNSKRGIALIILIGVIVVLVGQLNMMFASFFKTLGCITISLGVAFILNLIFPSAFKGFRNYTYQIYLMGIFAQVLIKIIYHHFSIPYVFAFLLCIAVGLYVPVLVSKVVEWINWKPLLMCVGLKQVKK